jgi:hypothetical protein
LKTIPERKILNGRSTTITGAGKRSLILKREIPVFSYALAWPGNREWNFIIIFTSEKISGRKNPKKVLPFPESRAGIRAGDFRDLPSLNGISPTFNGRSPSIPSLFPI